MCSRKWKRERAGRRAEQPIGTREPNPGVAMTTETRRSCEVAGVRETRFQPDAAGAYAVQSGAAAQQDRLYREQSEPCRQGDGQAAPQAEDGASAVGSPARRFGHALE